MSIVSATTLASPRLAKSKTLGERLAAALAEIVIVAIIGKEVLLFGVQIWLRIIINGTVNSHHFRRGLRREVAR